MPLILKIILSIAGCPNRWVLSFVIFFFCRLTVGGVYSVNSTEMMSGLGIISEHIQLANFVTSIGMAAFLPFPISVGVCAAGEDDVYCRVCVHVYIFSYICAKTDSVFLLALCSLLTGFLVYGTDDGQSVHTHLCGWNGSYPQYYSGVGAERYCRLE